MIPIHDDNPTQTRPYVTWALIATCVLVFLWQLTLSPVEGHRAALSFGMVPAVLFGQAALHPSLDVVPPLASLFTAMFLHGGWMHLIGNMLYLYIFGNNIEDAMGHARFVLFYAVCGAAAAFTQALMDPASAAPMIGASGAIAGVLGAYLVLYPHARILVIVPFFIIVPLRVPAMIVLGLWFLIQMTNVFSTTGADGGGVAWAAHAGGFVAGVALVGLFKRRSVRFFNPPRAAPARSGGGIFGPGPRGPRRQPPWARPEPPRPGPSRAEPMSKPRSNGPWGGPRPVETERPERRRSRIPPSGDT